MVYIRDTNIQYLLVFEIKQIISIVSNNIFITETFKSYNVITDYVEGGGQLISDIKLPKCSLIPVQFNAVKLLKNLFLNCASLDCPEH